MRPVSTREAATASPYFAAAMAEARSLLIVQQLLEAGNLQHLHDGVRAIAEHERAAFRLQPLHRLQHRAQARAADVGQPLAIPDETPVALRKRIGKRLVEMTGVERIHASSEGENRHTVLLGLFDGHGSPCKASPVAGGASIGKGPATAKEGDLVPKVRIFAKVLPYYAWTDPPPPADRPIYDPRPWDCALRGAAPPYPYLAKSPPPAHINISYTLPKPSIRASLPSI